MSSIYGYRLESLLPFTFVRQGPGDTPLTVTEGDGLTQPADPPLLQWPTRPDHPRGARLYVVGAGYAVWVDRAGWFQIDPRQATIVVSSSGEPLRREATLWGLPAALCYMERGDLPLHAAAIDVGGSAILLAGPGRSGKTTLACGFLQSGYRVLAEDLSCCGPSAPPLLRPGPSMLRVRRDTYEQLKLPGTNVVAEDPDRLTLAVAEPMKGNGRPLPVRAILLLGSSTAPLAIEQVALPAAIRALWSLSFMLPRDADRVRSFGAVTEIASAVPVWSLRWRRSFSEMPDVVNAILSAGGS